MSRIGMFFGTETGSTRLIAKKMHKKLGDEIADKPVNVNRITPAEFLAYDAYILGTPSYGEGDIPGRRVGCLEANWQEFIDRLDDADLRGKRIALFGLGAQERYSDRFCSSLWRLYQYFYGQGADIIGSWPTDGYTFNHSAAVKDGKFVGLVLDERTQAMYSNERMDKWLDIVRAPLLECCGGLSAKIK